MYVAQYDFQADTREELSVKKGEQMELVKKLDDSWAEVRIGRSKGLVPLSYIKKIEGGGGRKVPPAPQSRSAAPRVEQYIALYDFTAQSRDELSIREGEKMHETLVSKEEMASIANLPKSPTVPTNFWSNFTQYDQEDADDSMRNIQFNSDGTQLYIAGDENNDMRMYSLSTPYDVTTLSSTLISSIEFISPSHKTRATYKYVLSVPLVSTKTLVPPTFLSP